MELVIECIGWKVRLPRALLVETVGWGNRRVVKLWMAVVWWNGKQKTFRVILNSRLLETSYWFFQKI